MDEEVGTRCSGIRRVEGNEVGSEGDLHHGSGHTDRGDDTSRTWTVLSTPELTVVRDVGEVYTIKASKGLEIKVGVLIVRKKDDTSLKH